MIQLEMDQTRFDRFAKETTFVTGAPIEALSQRLRTPKHLQARRVFVGALFLDGHPYISIGRMLRTDHTSIMHQVKAATTTEKRMAKQVFKRVNDSSLLSADHVLARIRDDDLEVVGNEVGRDVTWGLDDASPLERIARAVYDSSLTG